MRLSCFFPAVAAVALVSAVVLPGPRPADNDVPRVSSDLEAAAEPEDANSMAQANGLLKPLDDDINIYIYDRKGSRIARYGKNKQVVKSEAYEEEEDYDDDERDRKEEKEEKKKKAEKAEKAEKKKAAEKAEKKKEADKAAKKKEADKAAKKKEAEKAKKKEAEKAKKKEAEKDNDKKTKTAKDVEDAKREMNRKKAEWAASDKKKAADAKKKQEKKKEKEEKAARDKKHEDEIHAKKMAKEERLKKEGKINKPAIRLRGACISRCFKMVLPVLYLPCISMCFLKYA
ncbi:hypothetical protein D7B24_006957 [Verticillium nonalfalfae]|uniref:Uncharacterized protein n=1 Tax=Verticillium nonalfalfae TaxID=1051616 RepID=A0A3M9Y8X6_9PEZI|nr:uncharacterized protein D7B24_006957 [Verticillium nonalfalfae]RNJ56711.1 hypothetical protein D7B24_006957 [Verticillium nonalfalfae]